MSNEVKDLPVDPWGSEKVTNETLKLIKESWTQESGADEFEAELGAVFTGIIDDISNPSDHNSDYWALTENGVYRAILEVIDTRRGRMTKLLTLHLSPTYWDTPSSQMLSSVYIAAVMEVLLLGFNRAADSNIPSHDVKIYGRNQELLTILRKIHEDWGSIESDKQASAHMEGRWLRITLPG